MSRGRGNTNFQNYQFGRRRASKGFFFKMLFYLVAIVKVSKFYQLMNPGYVKND